MSVDSVKLKSLQVQQERTKKEIEQVKSEYNFTLMKLNGLESSLAATQNEIDKLTTFAKSDKPIIVSEHALLRYLERIYNIDLSAIEKEILTPELVSNIRAFKEGKFPSEKCKVIVKNQVVTTILPKD